MKIITSKRAGHYGLSTEQARQSAEKNGRNIFKAVKKKGFLAHFFSNLSDPVIKILLFALAVNMIFVLRGSSPTESIGIGVSVFLATFISTLSERGSEAAFRRLSEECTNTVCRVMRDGVLCELSISEIVVGDIIFVSAGEQIGADCYVVEGEISVDQSSLTGESRDVRKAPSRDSERTPDSKSAVFRGCTVLSGDATLRVFAVGEATFLGKISDEVQLDTRQSPLKHRLTRLAKQISILGYIAAFLVAFASLFNTFVIDSAFDMRLIRLKLSDLSFLLENLLSAFMLGLTVIVVAVPEGLPMMIAVVLSSNIKRMMKDKVLVRKPVGIEAAGSMNLLLTDKTGTLTEGKMSVSKIILGTGEEYKSFAGMKKRCPDAARIYFQSCCYNTSSDVSSDRAVGGNATDRAFLESVLGDGFRGATYKLLYRLPFDSSRKYSLACILDKLPQTLIKGAPERILPKIKYCISESGKEVSFDLCSEQFTSKIGALTSSGGRVLLVARVSGRADSLQDIDTGLTLVCAVLLEDKIRQEAHRSVGRLRGAGVQVIMITGDNPMTARSIAKDCGIINSEQRYVLTSDELAALSDEELSSVLPSLAVIARALPQDKSRLVRVAQQSGAVVGMTGDGINDAPALKRADIGFAMGSGTQVAKDAGDIIILDNNLASIAKAVLYGRTIFKSIRKFITLQLTMNFCAVGVCMICPFIGFDSPVTVVQMLWINIIMDTLGGLAFAGEAPMEFCMREKPKRRDEPILNKYMTDQIVWLGSFTIALLLAFLKLPYFSSRFRYAPNNIYLLTAFFALFIFSSVFNCFNSRTDRINLLSGLSKNRAFIIIMAMVCVVQIAFTYLGGSVLRTAPLELSELFFTMLLALSVFPAELLRKIIWRLRGKNDGF